METIDDLRKLLKINKNKLHEECSRFPSIIELVYNKTVEAISVRDALKEEKDKVYAELFLEKKKSMDKVTETLADSLVRVDPRYVEISNSYLEAKKKADEYIALKDSFFQKGQMLKILADLFVSGYWTEIEVLRSKDKD
jgi:predicted AAA+ superfamily ATPase